MEYPGLQTQTGQLQSRNRLLQFLKEILRAQFGRPAGIWGAVVGKIMANTPSNKERIRWMISLLDIQPDDRLLEIGFGPGYAIELAGKIAANGFIAGVDHSEVMVRQARKRNSGAIRDGKVVLRHGSVSSLPEFEEPFDKIFAINSIHFWVDPVKCLRDLRTILKPGGSIAVMLQPRSRNATDETTREIGKEVAGKLEDAGFLNIRLKIKQAKPVSVACAIGTK